MSLVEHSSPERVRAAVLHPWSPHDQSRQQRNESILAATGLREQPRRFREADSSLAEAISLAQAISLDVCYNEAVRLTRISPATLLGGGSVERLGDIFKDTEIALVVVDHPLSPVQQRNLERAWNLKVIDRTSLILEIFGERARTREGQLQVELAALDFQRSRLVRSWTHLERQRGGAGFLGGPGETQLEIDRRLIDERMVRLRKDLEKVRQTRGLHRSARKRNEMPVVALVGYTNAGKSTLFNRLTTAGVMAENMLFATLDPTMRRLVLPSGRECILSDTVGFISSLPHQLVAAFRATLEEVEHADLILHIRDIAHDETDTQQQDVMDTLQEIGIDTLADSRLVEVVNKLDLLPPDGQEQAQNHANRHGGAAVSALSGDGMDGLLSLIEKKLSTQKEILDLHLPSHEGRALSWLYTNATILEREDDGEGRIRLKVALAPSDLGRWSRTFAALCNDTAD